MSSLRRLFAVVALALLIAPLVTSAPLFDPDEGLHAAIAQEMVARGDYVTPTFRGEPFLDKPILFFWAEAASLRLLGDREAAVRIPPLLFGLAGMLTVALLGRALSGENAGLTSGIVYGTMLLPMGVSEVAVHDVGLVPFLCVAALCLLRVGRFRRGDVSAPALFGWAVLAGVALGLSILTKGLVGIVFSGIFGLCLVAREPAAVVRVGIALSIAVVVALAVAAPWYVAMEHAHPGYLHYYFIERHLQGYLTATQRHGGRPFWYYLPIVVGGALPWTAYLAAALPSFAARRRTSPAEHERNAAGTSGPGPNGVPAVLWGWFATGLLFLSVGESKLVTYALPLFPALALIVGGCVAGRERGPLRSQPRLFRIAFAVHALTLAVLPAIGLALVQYKFHDTSAYLWIVAALAGAATLSVGWIAARAREDRLLMGAVAVMSLCTLAGMMVIAPRAAAWMSSRDLATALNASGALPPHVSIVDERIGSLMFYLAPPLRAEATPARVAVASFSEAMMRIGTDPPDAITVVRNSQLPRFNRLFPSPPAPSAVAGTVSLFRADALRVSLGQR